MVKNKDKIPKRPKKANDNKIYLKNSVMLEILQDWIEKRKENPDEPIPEKFAILLQMLIKRIGSKHIFSGYTFLEDMKSEAFTQCIVKAKNFNPEISNNPFSYFTTIIFNSFKKIIKEEKLQSSIKDDLFKNHTEILYDSESGVRLNLSEHNIKKEND